MRFRWTLAVLLTGLTGCGGGSPVNADTPEEMVLIPGGTFLMGRDSGHPDEQPAHRVVLKPFYLDRHEVTNRQFAAFVEATAYRTDSEKQGGAWCFLEGDEDFRLIEGADWRHPEGPDSSIDERMNHPVVNVSWGDAAAYARWAGKRLPTEAEWEYAARAGDAGHLSASQSIEEHPDVRQAVPANVWQGAWPKQNLKTDGYFYTAPTESYPPNEWGLFDMLGNVWEWCGDWYSADSYRRQAEGNQKETEIGDLKVARGGSWFCSPSYCSAYSTHYRGASPPNRGFNNVGFRCAADP